MLRTIKFVSRKSLRRTCPHVRACAYFIYLLALSVLNLDIIRLSYDVYEVKGQTLHLRMLASDKNRQRDEPAPSYIMLKRLAWSARLMARQQAYEPVSRLFHISFPAKRLLYVWGGQTVDIETGSEAVKIKLKSCIEEFNPDLEVWRQLNTAGTPHPGLSYAACVSDGENVFMYGGSSAKRREGVLSRLNLETLTWSQLSPETAGGPMRKGGCGLIIVQDKLVLIGGYGIPTGPIQPQATFVRNTMFTDVKGYSNEIHEFNMSQGSHSQVD